jgi:hypothetical protein
MTEGRGQGPPAERILDLLVYAPVGLVLSVAEAVPDLVRKGRERLGPQVGVARMVGEFAVRQGCRQFVGYATSRGAVPFGTAEPARTYTAYSADAPAPNGPAAVDGHMLEAQTAQAQTVQAQTAPAQTPPAQTAQVLPAEPVAPARQAPTSLVAEELAIPSYDSLSATQVVERLAGLSQDEIRAVAAYEAATRRRKTVLSRAEQLLKR